MKIKTYPQLKEIVKAKGDNITMSGKYYTITFKTTELQYDDELIKYVNQLKNTGWYGYNMKIIKWVQTPKYGCLIESVLIRI